MFKFDAQDKYAFLATAFVAATMTANIMSLRMVAPFGIVADAGVLLYPVTFVLRDLIHKSAGLAAANKTVVASCLCNALMFLMFAVAAWLPADPGTGPQTEYATVLMPGFLLVTGSVVGQFVSETVDGRIFHRLYRPELVGPAAVRNHAVSMCVSNAVSIPLDTLLMCTIAFGLWVPFWSLVSAILANIVVKFVVMLVSVAGVVVAERKQLG